MTQYLITLVSAGTCCVKHPPRLWLLEGHDLRPFAIYIGPRMDAKAARSVDSVHTHWMFSHRSRHASSYVCIIVLRLRDRTQKLPTV